MKNQESTAPKWRNLVLCIIVPNDLFGTSIQAVNHLSKTAFEIISEIPYKMSSKKWVFLEKCVDKGGGDLETGDDATDQPLAANLSWQNRAVLAWSPHPLFL